MAYSVQLPLPIIFPKKEQAMKSCLRKAFSIAAVLSFLMLAACSEPSAEGTGEGYFTISLSANENTRAVFPPTNSNDLRFSVKFKNTASGAEKTFTSDRSGSIKGKIGVGNHIVTMDINLISDGSLYARGVAYDNPVAIGSGQNPLKVYAFDVNNAAPPVISAKPQGAAYTTGATAKPLTVTASVNDSGELSYQWYSNTTNSTTGGTAIGSATSPSYTPPTTRPTGTPGTIWYYAVVKNNSAGKPTTINTVPVSIIVNSGIGGGTGSADDPFLVNDVTALRKVGSGTDGWTLDAHYRQTADISLPAASSGGSNWTPIGKWTKDKGGFDVIKEPFTGIYDGGGKTINNLTINAPSEDNQGLFGSIDSVAIIKNVGLVNCTIVGSFAVGSVVGYNYGTVQNCYATGNLSGSGLGGVVGENYGTVQSCYSTGTISASIGVGGVVGVNHNKVQNCYATGSVSGNEIIGGVVAENLGTVQSCYATGSVSGNQEVGGVVGFNYGGTMQNCYATGNVSGNTDVGGVAGLNYGTVQYCYATGNVSGNNFVGGVAGRLINVSLEDPTISVATLQNCVALNPNISSTGGTDIGRVFGSLSTSYGTPILSNNYGRSDMQKNGGSTSWANIGLNKLDGESVTSANWGVQSWWTTANNWKTVGWDFTNVWQWGSNNLPILRNMPGTATQNPVVSGTGGSGGIGTAADPFLVSTVASLQKVGSGTDGWTLDAHYKQTADINLSSVSNWTPIGTGSLSDGADTTYYFKGSYDGSGHTISNLTINTNVPTEVFLGLFGCIDGVAVVKNVGLATCTIISNQMAFAGGVVGVNQGTVQNCYTTGSVSVNVSNSNIGGGVLVSNAGVGGGVVGVNQGTVQNCYTTSSVSGYSASSQSTILVGGVVAMNMGTVQNCYATGNVSSNNEEDSNIAGGVVGQNQGIVQYCYATGNVSSNSVSGSSIAGGVVGHHSNPVAKVQNCVALNPNISRTGIGSIWIGRIVGQVDKVDTILANNYGRSDMKANGENTTWTNSSQIDHGESITSSNWGTESWWTTLGNWAQKGWPIGTVWEWRSNGLPILRNMPGTTTQNPVIK
jgi:hypothetical protein